MTSFGAGIAFLLFNPFVSLAVFAGNLFLLNVSKSSDSFLRPWFFFGIILSIFLIVFSLLGYEFFISPALPQGS